MPSLWPGTRHCPPQVLSVRARSSSAESMQGSRPHLAAGGQKQHSQSPLMDERVGPRPSVDWQFYPTMDAQVNWKLAEPGEPHFTGEVCIDGSRLGNSMAPQAGWAAIQLKQQKAGQEDEDEVEVEKEAWGPTPLQLPIDASSIKRSEMHAFWFILSQALLPLVIWTDHKEIVQGLQRGRLW